MTSPALLAVKQLQKSFPGKSQLFGLRRGARATAVASVTFDVFASETLAIIGESGCGKPQLVGQLRTWTRRGFKWFCLHRNLKKQNCFAVCLDPHPPPNEDHSAGRRRLALESPCSVSRVVSSHG